MHAKIETSGRLKLLKLLRPIGRLSEREVGEATGVTQPSVSAWKSGDARPGPIARELLSEHFGIPASDWITAEEKTQRAEARRRIRGRNQPSV